MEAPHDKKFNDLFSSDSEDDVKTADTKQH